MPNRLGTINNPIPGVIRGETVYFWSLLLPNGEELQIVTRRPIPTDAIDNVNAATVLAAAIYPQRLDHV